MNDEDVLARIRKIHRALGLVLNSDLSSLQVEMGIRDNCFWSRLDISNSIEPGALEDHASQLLGGIATIRDYLKIWCEKRGKIFNGDRLINSKTSVAIVHDLWNVEKHAVLNRPPRSGFVPRLGQLSRAMKISTGAEAGSVAGFSMDPFTGEYRAYGDVKLVISGNVLNEKNEVVGDFLKICEDAISAWTQEISDAGLPINVISEP